MVAAVAHRPLSSPLNLTLQQGLKVAAVAIAALLYFGAAAALFCATVTLLSELTLRNEGEGQNWFCTRSFTAENLLKDATTLFLGKSLIVIAWVALAALGFVVLPPGPVQVKLAEMAASKPFLFLIKAIFLAPICEEILFRGFLQERIEDAAELCNRHLTPIPKETQQKFANIFQATLFGYVHVINNQVEASVKWLVALSTGWCGFVFGLQKIQSGSLVRPIAAHGIHNVVASIGILREQKILA